MRKVFTVSISVVAVFSLVVATAFAGSKCCSADKQTSVEAAGCAAVVKSTSGHTCTTEEMAACAARLGIEVEQCRKLCASGDIKMVRISIEGMTSKSCENAVSESLEKASGVVRVHDISYQIGTASVCIDRTKGSTEDLVKTISKKGYEAEIILAETKVTCVKDTKKACSTTGKKCCASKSACTKKEKAACSGKTKVDKLE